MEDTLATPPETKDEAGPPDSEKSPRYHVEDITESSKDDLSSSISSLDSEYEGRRSKHEGTMHAAEAISLFPRRKAPSKKSSIKIKPKYNKSSKNMLLFIRQTSSVQNNKSSGRES